MNILVKAYTLSECMDATADYVKAYEAVGMANLIFCEDRLTLIAERTIVRALGGSFFTSVTTFGRFLRAEVSRLGKQGSVMAISGIMAELQKEGKLKCFTEKYNLTKDSQCVYETIAQLAAARVDAKTLEDSLADIAEPVLKEKVADLALIYARYDEFLGENGYVDDSRYLSLLPDAIRADKSMKNTNVFFVGYTAFTKQAAEAMKAAAESAANVIGIFCGGEEAFYTNAAADRFYQTCSAVGKTELRKWYYPLDGEAEILRKSLFEPKSIKDTIVKTVTDKINLFEGENRSDEAEKCAVNIRKIMAERKDMRYRDIAVLLPDVGAYQLPIRKAFEEYNIPYFFDEKRSLKKHPLAEFILACFEVVKERYSPVSVYKLTQNVFFGESEEYRNYLLKFANYRGGASKDIKDENTVKGFDLEAVNAGKDRLTKAVENIKSAKTGRDYCLAIDKLLEDFNVWNVLLALSDTIEDPSLKSYLTQIEKALPVVLTDAKRLLASRELSVTEFAAILSNGLEAVEISLIPLKTDAVYVGDIVDSRIEKVRALFALGFTDDVPRASKDAALLTDRDIERLKDIEPLIEPTVAEANLRATENFCLNLCTFSDALYISYPLSDKGEEPALSEALRYVKGVFEPTNEKVFIAKKEVELKYACSTKTPAIRRLMIEKGRKEADKKGKNETYDTLYKTLTELGVDATAALTSREYANYISKGDELFLGAKKISPTKLEKYFTCPFENFMSNGLKLKEREESVVMSVDSGNFIHAVLKEVGKNMSTFNTEDEAREFARRLAEEESQKPAYAAGRDTESGKYASDSLCREAETVAAAVFRQIKNSAFVIKDTEKKVSTDVFAGKVDRVDETDKYVRIVDYKSGAISDGASDYYAGVKMQMQLYMLAAQGNKIPAGVFYFPAAVDYLEKEENRFQMKGFLNADEAALKAGDSTLKYGKTSEFFEAGIGTKLSAACMNGEDFKNFIEYAKYLAEQGTSELKKGFIAASPYGSACKWCQYGGICGFDKERNATRNGERTTAKAIVEIVKKKKEND